MWRCWFGVCFIADSRSLVVISGGNNTVFTEVLTCEFDILFSRQWLLAKGKRRRRSRLSALVLRWPKERMCLVCVTSSPPSTILLSMSLTCLASKWKWQGMSTKTWWLHVAWHCICCQGNHLPCDWWHEGKGRQRRVVSICCHVGGSGCRPAVQRAWNHCSAHQVESHWRKQVLMLIKAAGQH